MPKSASPITDTGLEVIDLASDAAFAKRRIHSRDIVTQMEVLRGIARAFVETPQTILQELVNAAVQYCGADSAGISMEANGSSDQDFYHWVATAGVYTDFLNVKLPRYPSACGIALDRGTPQLFRVNQAFFDILGVSAPLVTDGLLLPWQTEDTRGTIFIMAHGRTEAFDQDDCRLMQVLADFAAMGVRQQKQQKLLLEQTGAAAAAAMADKLAHRINNPLQSLTNLLFLASIGHNGEQAKELGEAAMVDLQRLSSLVSQLLDLRYQQPG